jgi:hypothetical protein
MVQQQGIWLLYILEQRSSHGTLWIRPSWPRSGLKLSPALASPHKHASCCLAQPGTLLFIEAVQVSPQCLLLSGWLLTNVQVNITTALHDTWHTCRYITTILLLIFFFLHFFHFPGKADCPPLALSITRGFWHFSQIANVCQTVANTFWSFVRWFWLPFWLSSRHLKGVLGSLFRHLQKVCPISVKRDTLLQDLWNPQR